MAGIQDYIVRRLLAGQQGEAQREAPQPPARVQTANAQMAAPEQAAGQGVDPRVDFIAKKLALIEGAPEEKYQIFVQILPQIVEALGASAANAVNAASVAPNKAAPGGDQYEVTSNMGAY